MNPDKLYSISLFKVVRLNKLFSNKINILPIKLLFDVYYNVMINHNVDLSFDMFDLEIFNRFINQVKERRNELHQMFQCVIDNGTRMDRLMSIMYLFEVKHLKDGTYDRRKLFKIGVDLAIFLIEAGWYEESENILNSAISLYSPEEVQNDPNLFLLMFECQCRKLNVYNSNACFEKAKILIHEIDSSIKKHHLNNQQINLAQIYTEFSRFYFMQCDYDESLKWSIRSFEMLNHKCSSFVMIDVLRQLGKICVYKRKFKKAKLLMNQVLVICKNIFNLNEECVCDESIVPHLKLAEVFSDYAFYLLNTDVINISIKYSFMGLDIRKRIFSFQDKNCYNLLLAQSLEEYAYTSYVYNYNSGRLRDALDNSVLATEIFYKLLPDNHINLASSKKVRALILEEIAIDHPEKEIQNKLLLESKKLHLTALDITKNIFGECNVQTAKLYGNLGRLFQSMKKYDKAEEMHLKAIKIKEQLLGPEDYEVALSIGHLASLYNYDIGLFEKAEQLYLKSIEIGIKLFGEGYSGLEYDYRGLQRVYMFLNDTDKMEKYSVQLLNWQRLRDSISLKTEKMQIENLKAKKLSLSNILDEFHRLN